MSFRQGARQFFERRGAPTPTEPPWLEIANSSDNAYSNSPMFDTGITPDATTEYEFSMLILKKRAQYCNFFISRSSTDAYGYANNFGVRNAFKSDTYVFTANSAGSMNDYRISQNASFLADRFTVKYQIGEATLTLADGTTTTKSLSTASQSFTGLPTVKIWGDGLIKYCTPANGTKLWYVKIWQGGSLVRDMVPALASNGQGCLYDKVSAAFFKDVWGNSGDVALHGTTSYIET